MPLKDLAAHMQGNIICLVFWLVAPGSLNSLTLNPKYSHTVLPMCTLLLHKVATFLACAHPENDMTDYMFSPASDGGCPLALKREQQQA